MERAVPSPEFAYRDGQLHTETVPITRIATEVGTPFYCYSTAALTRNYRAFADAFAGQDASICYAVKANGNLAVIATLAQLGAGADVVSEGELRRALAAGVPADRIVFSGVGKTRAEMEFAVDTGIHQINVESRPELEALSDIAAAKRATVEVAIRVNPDVDARTHRKIATGKAESKFGIDLPHVPDVYARARSLPGIEPVGIAVHIGSQLTSLEPFREAFAKVADLVLRLRGNGIDIRRVDAGGGLGVVYAAEEPPALTDYAGMIREIFGPLGCTLTLEPGRALVGNAGVLVTRILYLKQGLRKRFLVIDAAMNDLVRPTVYDAWHDIVPVREPSADAKGMPVDVVGPVCETGDSFAVDRMMPPAEANDLLAVCSAGAYGAVMASTYNARLLVPEVLVSDGRYAVVRPRPSYEDLIGLDRLPDWLSGTVARGRRGVA